MHDLDSPLTPEADKFLAEACAEYDAKQQALTRDWHFDSSVEWGFEQDTGVFTLQLHDGSQVHANGQILGSYSPDDKTWEWAWNNPHIDSLISADSRIVRQVGEDLGIAYLLEGVIPAPEPQHVAYLCGIGLKATCSVGVFEGDSGPISVFIMLKSLRRMGKS